MTFNRAVVVRYRSHLEGRRLSASTINLHLSAIRSLADESAETGWLTPELAIGIRRVQGVKRLGQKSGNWLSQNQAQELVNAASKADLRGWRDGAILGLLLGCGLRRSEVVGLTLDQVQTRDGRWVIVDLIGKGRRLRTVPVPSWSKQLLDAWLQRSGVSEGRVFRRISKQGRRQEAGVTANVVWYAVKRCAGQAGIANLAPHDLRRTCARLCHDCNGELEQIRFLLGHASVQTTERYIGSKQKLHDAVNDRFGISVASETAYSPPGRLARSWRQRHLSFTTGLGKVKNILEVLGVNGRFQERRPFLVKRAVLASYRTRGQTSPCPDETVVGLARKGNRCFVCPILIFGFTIFPWPAVGQLGPLFYRSDALILSKVCNNRNRKTQRSIRVLKP